jgi:hypothetical protein
MDIQSILVAFAGSSTFTTVLGWRVNRKLNAIAAQKAEVEVKSDTADYTAKILDQADKRVEQTIADRERAISERDKAYTEAKEQRKAKQEHRQNWLNEQAKSHRLELQVKELEGRLREERWYRCETIACQRRVPPRTENNS